MLTSNEKLVFISYNEDVKLKDIIMPIHLFRSDKKIRKIMCHTYLDPASFCVRSINP